METLLLLTIIGGMSLQNVSKKAFNKKTGGKGTYLFSAVSMLTAAVFFAFAGEKSVTIDCAWMPYSLGFAVSCGISVVCSFLAIQCGSLSLTSLATSYSLIIPTIYGLVFLNETSGIWLYLGIILLMISLVLINNRDSDVKITVKWAVFAFFAFLGNGVCTTVQKMQQIAFDGEAKNEFMMVALLVLSAFMFVLAFVWEKQVWGECFKKGSGWMVLCGVANGAVNLFVMILAGYMPASVMFPLVSAGGILLTAAISRWVYREKLTRRQSIGLVLGIGAVIFLNL